MPNYQRFRVVILILIHATCSSCQNSDSHRGFGSSLWGQMHHVGSQWIKTVQNSVDEIGKVAGVLAGDATDAVNTVSTFCHFISNQSVFFSQHS